MLIVFSKLSSVQYDSLPDLRKNLHLIQARNVCGEKCIAKINQLLIGNKKNPNPDKTKSVTATTATLLSQMILKNFIQYLMLKASSYHYTAFLQSPLCYSDTTPGARTIFPIP